MAEHKESSRFYSRVDEKMVELHWNDEMITHNLLSIEFIDFSE